MLEYPDNYELNKVKRRIAEAQAYEAKIIKRYRFWENEARKLRMEVKAFGDFESSQGSQCADVEESDDDLTAPADKKPRIDPESANNVFNTLVNTMTAGPSVDQSAGPGDANADTKPQLNESAAPDNVEPATPLGGIPPQPEGPEDYPEDVDQAVIPRQWHFIQTFVSN